MCALRIESRIDDACGSRSGGAARTDGRGEGCCPTIGRGMRVRRKKIVGPARGVGMRFALLVQSYMIIAFAAKDSVGTVTSRVLVELAPSILPLAMFVFVSAVLLMETIVVCAYKYEVFPRTASVLWILWAALMSAQAFVAMTYAPGLYALWGGYAMLAVLAMHLSGLISKEWK